MSRIEQGEDPNAEDQDDSEGGETPTDPSTEFSFPGPDDCSWSKYEEALAESHDGSEEEEEEGMEVPCTCELEVQTSTVHCTEREAEEGSGSCHMLGIAWGEILPSLQSLPGLPQGSVWEMDGSQGR